MSEMPARAASGRAVGGNPRTILAAGETMAMVVPVAPHAVAEADAFLVIAGGAESNVASHVVALGHRALWFSRLGDDALGRRVVSQLARSGVDVSRVIFDPLSPTGLYVKDPLNSITYYRRGSAASQLSSVDAEGVDFTDVDVLHVSGITAALSPSASEFLSSLVKRAKERDVLVSFDVNYRAALWDVSQAAPVLAGLANQADIVFVGRDEAEVIWATRTPSDIRKLFRSVPELVVKDGAVGAFAFVEGDEVFAPSRRAQIVDPVGAGDAFAGGYLARHMSGAPLEDRLRTGHLRAALTMAVTSDAMGGVAL